MQVSLKPIELNQQQKGRVLVSLQGIAPYFRLGSNVYNIFITTNNMERAQKFQILVIICIDCLMTDDDVHATTTGSREWHILHDSRDSG